MVHKNNGKIETFKVDVDMFGMKVDVCLGSYENTKKHIESEYEINTDSRDYFLNSDGVLIDLEKDFGICCTIVLALKNFRRILDSDMPYAMNLLAHECLHAATAIMDDRGIPVNLANDEVIAYIQSFLVQKIVENLKEIGLGITLEEGR